MMNILLFGKGGQVGWELQRALAPLGNLTALDYTSTTYCGDFLNPVGIAETIKQLKPDVIVNAAAYTAVDKAESESELAFILNVQSVETIAHEAKKLNAWVVHYSTDYVFSGDGDIPRKETDPTSPLNVYGKTKLAGEEVLQQYCEKYLIFRTSWVYASKGNNFAKTMLKLAKNNDVLSIISDQFGAPTGAELIADCTAHAIVTAQARPDVAGLYHLVASGVTTWADYAEFIFDKARSEGVKLVVKDIKKVSTINYPTIARRPNNSRLSTDKFRTTFNLQLPPWQLGVERMLAEMFNSTSL